VALGQVFSENFSTIIFTITRGWHNRPGVAAVPITSQKNTDIPRCFVKCGADHPSVQGNLEIWPGMVIAFFFKNMVKVLGSSTGAILYRLSFI
jgi:hypothetical protein